jgi:DNA-directed RNA polymerase specialized sigma24 family protein
MVGRFSDLGSFLRVDLSSCFFLNYASRAAAREWLKLGHAITGRGGGVAVKLGGQVGENGVASSGPAPERQSVAQARSKPAGRGRRSPFAIDAATRQALERLYLQHYVSLVRLAALLTGSPVLAEEIAADSIAAVAPAASRSTPEAELVSLRQQVVLRSRLAPARRRAAAPGDSDVPAAQPPDAAQECWQTTQVMQALRSLSTRQREVIVLSYYLDLTGPEIAGVSGSGVRAVPRILASASAAFEAALGEAR